MRYAPRVQQQESDDSDDIDTEDEDEDEDEESDEDVPIEPHKRYTSKHIDHRRKLEGLVLNELNIVTVQRRYDFDRAMRHVNPLRRPILFVPSSGADQRQAEEWDEKQEEAVALDLDDDEMAEVDRMAAEALALSGDLEKPASTRFAPGGVFATPAPLEVWDAPAESSAEKPPAPSDVAPPALPDEGAAETEAAAPVAAQPTEKATSSAWQPTEATASPASPEAAIAHSTDTLVPAAPEDGASPRVSPVSPLDVDMADGVQTTQADAPSVPSSTHARREASGKDGKRRARRESDVSSKYTATTNASRRAKNKSRRANKVKPFAREDSDIEWGSDGPPVSNDNSFQPFQLSEQLMTTERKPLSQQDAILADWMENAMRNDEDDEDEDEDEDEDTLSVRGLGQVPTGISDPYQEEMTLEDIAIDAQHREDDTWLSSDEEDDDEEEEDKEDEKDEEDEEDEEDEDEDEEEDEDDEIDEFDDIEVDDSSTDIGLDEHIHALLLNGLDSSQENLALGLPTWDNKAPRKGKGKSKSKTMFERVTQGDFADDEVLGQPARRRRDAPKFSQEDLWAEELQLQWEKDRSSKAAKKRARAEARHTAMLNPYPNTHGMSKKDAKRLDKKARRSALKGLIDDDGPVTGEVIATPTSFGAISAMIDQFLADDGRTTLTLPPMLKRDRALVHNMADAYALKSKSKGKGKDRFPILFKTSKTGSRVDRSRIRRLQRTPFGAMDDAQFDREGRTPQGHVRIGPDMAPRNRDGARVGGNAKRIGEDNIGHRLLASMGWQSGTGLGHTHGIAEPIGATIKVSRSGLGL